MISFELSAEQCVRQGKAREFAGEYIAPNANLVDRQHQFPWDVVEKGIRSGLTRMLIPSAYGGEGYDNVSAGLVLEELGAACAGMATIFGASILGSGPIVLLGTEEQKQRLLRRITEDESGQYLCGFAVTEPASGSAAPSGDPHYGVQLRARREADAYLLSGCKRFISNAGVARLFSVLARTHPTKTALGGLSFFAVEASTGVQVGIAEDKMGQCACPTAEIRFDDVSVPSRNLLGKEGLGAIGFAQTISFSTPLVAAVCVGVARAATETATRYARAASLLDNQGVAMRLFDMATKLEAARNLVWRALWHNDQHVDRTNGRLRGAPNLRLAAMAKVFASDTCVQLVDEAVQIVGPAALVEGHTLSKLVRDAKLMQIFEGTNQIHRIATARLL